MYDYMYIEDAANTATAVGAEAEARPARERVDAAARRALSDYALHAAELGTLRGHVAALNIAAQRQREEAVATACAAATTISADGTGSRGAPLTKCAWSEGAGVGVTRGGGGDSGRQLSRGAHSSSRERMSSPHTGCTDEGDMDKISKPRSTERLGLSSGPSTQVWPPPSPMPFNFGTTPSPAGCWTARPGTRAVTAAGLGPPPSTPCAGVAYRLEHARLNSPDRSSPRARSPLRSPLSSRMTLAEVASHRKSSSRARPGPRVGLLAPAQQSVAGPKLSPSRNEVLPQLRHGAYDYKEFETAHRQASPA